MRREVLVLEEIADAAEEAVRLVDGVTAAELVVNRVRRDALLWNFTVVGEAVAQLPDDLTAKYPDVPWRQPQRLRNRIVHGYWSIDIDILHTTARDQLPQFAEQVRAILADLNEATPPADRLV